MTGRRYDALVEMGARLLSRWRQAQRDAQTAEDTGNEPVAEYHRGEMRDYGNRLQALGDVAAELFDRRYDAYMEQVHQRNPGPNTKA